MVAGNEELILSFEWSGLTLTGSLHLPLGPGPHHAVVMAQGSGPSDRDADGYFVPIRQCFLERGIATFAFDKPGCGSSSGDWRNYGLEDRTQQLVTALDIVRENPAIRDQRVGAWGHSQGGWLVQKLAGRNDALDFAVTSSGPSLNVADQIVYDCEQTIRDDGFSKDAVNEALILARSIQSAAASKMSFESLHRELITSVSNRNWFASFPTIDDAMDWHHFTKLVVDPHDPATDLEGATCPFLAVFGGLDDLLPPWTGAEDIGRALTAAGNSDATVMVFPGGSHRLEDPATGEFVTGYLETLGDWAAHRAFR